MRLQALLHRKLILQDENKKIKEFEEKPEHPRSNLASMGIYIFNWKVLRDSLIAMKDQSNCDFGKHIIPYCHENGKRLFAYEFNGYWKDVPVFPRTLKFFYFRLL